MTSIRALLALFPPSACAERKRIPIGNGYVLFMNSTLGVMLSRVRKNKRSLIIAMPSTSGFDSWSIKIGGYHGRIK